jgi:branched-chain amino acid transport system permease protein
VLSEWLFAIYNGVAIGMSVFLVAAGLSWVFGILKILNMAHGNFFMVGAYVAFSVGGKRPESFLEYIGAALVAGAVVAVLGFITDKVMLRRLRNVDYHYVLIGTFALAMFVEGVVKLIWGMDVQTVNPPPSLDEPVEIGGVMVPKFTLFAIGAGLVVFAALDYILQRTWAGKLMQSLANDPWMAGMLGINVPVLLTVSVIASFALAGFAGGLLVPFQSLAVEMGGSYLLLAFFAVIIGGLGNIRGAFLASLLLGLVQNISTILVPNFPGLTIYVALAVFLVWWPNGIFPPVGTK